MNPESLTQEGAHKPGQELQVTVPERGGADNFLSLSPADVRMFAGLGIGEGLLRAAQVGRVTDVEARRTLSITRAGDMGGVVFPYLNPLTGYQATSRIRRDKPEVGGDGRAEMKYVCGYGDNRHLYFPPGAGELLKDTSSTVIFVEAEKAALALTAFASRTGRRLLPIATGGCWGWRGRCGTSDPEVGSSNDRGPLPDFGLIDFTGRRVILLFDSNVLVNGKVWAARRALAETLRRWGAEVLAADIPQDGRVNGPDDYLERFGDGAIGDLLERAKMMREGGAPPPDRKVGRSVEVVSEGREWPDLLHQGAHDYGNAMRVKDCFGDRLLYCPPMGTWFVWTGVRWERDTAGLARKLAQQVLCEFLRQQVLAKEKEDGAVRFARASLDNRRIEGALAMLEPHLPILPAQFDPDSMLLNCANGAIDLRTGRLRPHRPEDRMSKLVGFAYHSDAPAPELWLRFLSQALNENAALMDYLQRAFGCAATGDPGERKVFLLLGPGSNGKTTALATVRHVLGDYAAQIRVESLMAGPEGQSASTLSDLAGLRGARFAMSSETESGQVLSVARLKYITQGFSLIKVRSIYQDFIEFPATHKLFLDCNHRPKIRDQGLAVWSRLKIVPFIVPVGEPQLDFPLRLQEESPSILSWLVHGALAWQERGLSDVAQVSESVEEWRQDESRCENSSSSAAS